MRIEALHHVQLAMPPGGEPQARAFYQDVLGIPEVDKPAARCCRCARRRAAGGAALDS